MYNIEVKDVVTDNWVVIATIQDPYEGAELVNHLVIQGIVARLKNQDTLGKRNDKDS